MAVQKPKPANPVHPRDYPILRPYSEECPKALLGCIPKEQFNLDNIRIMKHGQKIIAAYRFSRTDQFGFFIHSIKVHPSYRGKGIGKWLLFHVLGIVESKGGRFVRSHPTQNQGFFESAGFVRQSNGSMEYTILPE